MDLAQNFQGTVSLENPVKGSFHHDEIKFISGENNRVCAQELI